MSVIDIEQALIRRFLAMPTSYKRLRPNEAGNITAPAYVIQVSAASQVTMGMSPLTEAMGEIVVRVDTPENQYATLSNQMVQAIVDWFKIGDRFDGVTVTERPSPRPPFSENGVYSVPVIVRGRGYF